MIFNKRKGNQVIVLLFVSDVITVIFTVMSTTLLRLVLHISWEWRNSHYLSFTHIFYALPNKDKVPGIIFVVDVIATRTSTFNELTSNFPYVWSSLRHENLENCKLKFAIPSSWSCRYGYFYTFDGVMAQVPNTYCRGVVSILFRWDLLVITVFTSGIY